MRRLGKCVHFNGLPFRIDEDYGKCCDAGVNYRALVGGSDFGWMARTPCTKTTLSKDVVLCDKYRDPTPEEIKEDQRIHKAALERMRTIMPVVAEWRKKPPRGKQEIIECPACKGRLHLSQAASNGHVWGKCETPGCASWME